MIRRSLVLCVLAVGCAGSPPGQADGASEPDSGTRDAGADGAVGFDGGHDAGADASVDGGSDAGFDAGADAGGDGGRDASVPDAGVDGGRVDGGGADGGPDAGGWRSSLTTCWTDATCPRVMAIAHGGAWTTSIPYDSNGALAAAYAGGLDGVKIDVRITSDNVAVIAHSSPIQLFESVDCYNQSIENMTAAQVTRCHRVPSTTETFQRLDDVLTYLRGKMVVQLCVKRSMDLEQIVQAVHLSHAEDFAFLEISTGDLQTLVPNISGSGTVWYLINVASTLSEVDTLLNVINNPRAFMYEFDPTVQVGNLVTTRLHPAGIRSFTYDNSGTATVQQLKAHFDDGFDVVSANTAANAVQARQEVNQARGISPP